MLAETHGESPDVARAKTHGTDQMGYVAGSEKVLSVTDRVVKPAATASETAGEASEMAADTATESSKPLPASGWTARRPAADVQR
jgi:hypothetical protein